MDPDSDGKVISSVGGYVAPARFAAFLEKAIETQDKGTDKVAQAGISR